MKRLLTLFLVCLTITLPLSGRISCLFSPDDKPTKKLLEYIRSAQKSIYIAMYMLTDKNIAEALIIAKKSKNLNIHIIVDPITAEGGSYGKADLLAANGIDVFVFDPKIKPLKTPIKNDRWGANGAIMHNKFAIFDEVLLWTGSFNWTVSANMHNSENVIITDDRDTCKKYRLYFETLMNRCHRHVAPAGKNKQKSSLHQSLAHLLQTTPDDATLLEQLTYLIGNYAIITQKD